MSLTTTAARPADAHTQELTSRITWIIQLRWIAAAGVGATIWLVPRFFGVELAVVPLYAVTACLAAYNAVLWSVRRFSPQVTRGLGLFLFTNLQISIDLVFLTVLLHFSGGIENRFVCYYVFHIVIASILLSRRATYFQVALALGLLAGMGLAESHGLLPHYHLGGFIAQELYREPAYVAAVGAVSGTMLFFTAFMATSITARLREREKEIFDLSASLRQRADELQLAYDRLKEVERGKSEYMRRAAHNLRSPLGAVGLMLAVVCSGRAGSIPETARSMLERTRKRVDEALDVARDLLALSRAREAEFTVEFRTVDLAGILQGIEEEHRQRAESCSVSLEICIESTPLEIVGDPASMAELLDNLISNATKYTPAGGKVRVELSRHEGSALILVADSGIGIPAEERDRVFDEFFRAQNARQSGKEGTGLGLSIVKAIVDSHGGTISAESEVGAGTTFRVVLPSAPRTGRPAPVSSQGSP
jgi:signal transduction histidine kinase